MWTRSMQFVVTVPAGWQRLTAEELAELERRQQAQYGAGAAREDARMRLSGRGPSSFPFITVTHEICQPTTLEHAHGLLPGSTIDGDRKAVLFSKDDGGGVTRSGAVFPCRSGTVNVLLLCQTAEVDTYRPAWEAALDSVTFELGAGYPEPSTSSGTDKRWLLAAAVAVVVVVYLYRRRSHASKPA
jgi:hypothetical protein